MHSSQGRGHLLSIAKESNFDSVLQAWAGSSTISTSVWAKQKQVIIAKAIRCFCAIRDRTECRAWEADHSLRTAEQKFANLPFPFRQGQSADCCGNSVSRIGDRIVSRPQLSCRDRRGSHYEDDAGDRRFLLDQQLQGESARARTQMEDPQASSIARQDPKIEIHL